MSVIACFNSTYSPCKVLAYKPKAYKKENDKYVRWDLQKQMDL